MLVTSLGTELMRAASHHTLTVGGAATKAVLTMETFCYIMTGVPGTCLAIFINITFLETFLIFVCTSIGWLKARLMESVAEVGLGCGGGRLASGSNPPCS